jgi:uncharacterized protein (DUF924 family)
MPWREDSSLDFAVVVNQQFCRSPDIAPLYRDLTFKRALKPMSTMGLDHMPDLMQFLPPPEACDFPSKALGLLLLLDQAPRFLFSGINERWIYAYFDVLASGLARRLFTLPPSLRPDSLKRLMAQGWSFDYSMVARVWLTIALVHSERLDDHELQLAAVEDMRELVEKHVGRTDPNRTTVEEDSEDVLGLMNVALLAPVRYGTRMDDFIFWVLRLFLVHTPIIRAFGRYPYRNNSVGRVSTEEELQYAEDTDHFLMHDDEWVVKKIREDVEVERWSPLRL